MIEEKRYYYIRIKLLSPLSIGSGENTLTDHDCIRDFKGNPIIPGTSLAGCFSSYLTPSENEIFTPKIANEYKMSPYFISDAVIPKDKIKEVHTSIRDGVKLDSNKIAEDGAKYDMEIVESGTIFDFRIEVIIRKNDNKEQMIKLIDVILNGINNGEILFGLKSKRGYGHITIEKVLSKEFRKENLEELLNFDPFNIESYEEYNIPDLKRTSEYDIIKVFLKQQGGISIRKYSAQKGNVDFEHITSNNIPVIPGTSWAGLFRSQIDKYLQLPIFKEFCKTSDWFGTVDKNIAKASNIIFEESIINNAEKLDIFRNKIDRFSGGVKNGALFAERSYFEGNTILTIKVKKKITDEDNTKIKALILLVIKDISNGLISLGGQSSIGRGLFAVQKVIINEEEYDINQNTIGDVVYE